MTTLGQRIREHPPTGRLVPGGSGPPDGCQPPGGYQMGVRPERPQHGEPLPPGGALRHHGGPAAPIRGGGRSGGRGTSTPVVRIRWRPRVLAALAVTAGYLVFYLLGRILWCPLEDSSLLGWLLWERPSGGESYLYGWLLSSGLFWWAMALSALTALLGWYRLSCTTCAYFLIGFLMGLVLGPTRRERPWDTGTTAGPSGDASICCPSPWGCWRNGRDGRA